MDPVDLLNQFRNAYFIGNYSKLLEIWNENSDESFGDCIMEINFIVSRSLIC